MKTKSKLAIEWLDNACESEEESHDFVCRLRNAMRGLDYEEGCPALDYIFNLFCEDKSDVETPKCDVLRKQFEECPDWRRLDDLDDLVHTLAASEASATNNTGIDSQIDFIIKQLGDEHAAKQLESILKGNGKTLT